MKERVQALLEASSARRALKQWGKWLDDTNQPELRAALVAEGLRRGAELPDDAISWPGKRLLRRAQGREAVSRVRTNPIMRDEAFTCAACGRDVPPHGRTARDHCPHCLCSLHVDVVPGDRAEGCGGILRATALELRSGEDWRLRYRCERCGAERVNRVLSDGEPPDDPRVLRALAGRAAR